MEDEAELHSPIHLPFEASLCNVWLGVMVEKNWAHSVDQCWLQVFQFSGHLIDLLSLILRCNTFTWIQNTVVDQTGSRPSVTVTFFWYRFGFGKCFGAS